MRSLTDAEPGAKVTVKKIDGGTDVRKHLDDLSIIEGVELNVMEQVPAHEHRGAISIRIEGKEIILGHGMAEKIYLEKAGSMTTLLELEEGDRGVVKSFGGGRYFSTWFHELGIKEGTEVEFLRHMPVQTLIFNVADKEIMIGEGIASKVLAEHEGKAIQINYLKKGEKAKVTRIIGGANVKQRLDEMGFEEGAEITLVDKEMIAPPIPLRGGYVRVRLGEQMVTIGYGIAKKVWVE
ncbi:MAG: FeoA family protein [Thermodesulfovibrionales bacterium]|nr:FeoA family protein [Thermodesulfovibrionales bacterium]